MEGIYTGWTDNLHLRKGALHRDLGVPEGQKIPAAKLEQATHSNNPKVRKRADLAEEFRKMQPGGGS